MAFVLVQHKNSGAVQSGANPTCVFTNPVASGNNVKGSITWGSASAADFSSITDDKGNTYSISDKILGPTNTQSLAFFHAENITNGPKTLTATMLVGGQSFILIEIEEWSGEDTSGTAMNAHGGQRQATPGTGTDAITSGNITTTVSGCNVVGCTMDNLASVVIGTGETLSDDNTANNPGTLAEHKTQAGSGNVASTFTDTGGPTESCTVAAAFKAAGTTDDKVYSYEDGSLQLVEPEEWSEIQGFTADPLQPNLPAQVDQLISYFPDEAEEPSEEWLWPDYWAQAPPIPDVVDTAFVEDGSLQPVEPEEQHEVQDFLAGPLSPNAPAAQDQIQVEDASNQLEEDEFAEGFSDAPQTVLVADQIYVEDASLQPVEDDEFLEGFADAQVDNYDIIQSLQEQPIEEEEAEGFSDAPLAADFSADFIQGDDASAQPDELDDADGQDYNFAPLSDDAIVDASYIEPYDDASSQPDELDDADSQDFVVAPLPDDAPPAPASIFAVTPGKLPPWPWSWTHDAAQQKPDSPQFIRNLQRAMLLEQELRAKKAKLEREFSQKKLAAASIPAAQQKSALQNREYAILRRKIRAAEEEHSKAVTVEIELRLRAMEYETAQREAVAARRKRELMMVLLLA